MIHIMQKQKEFHISIFIEFKLYYYKVTSDNCNEEDMIKAISVLENTQIIQRISSETL